MEKRLQAKDFSFRNGDTSWERRSPDRHKRESGYAETEHLCVFYRDIRCAHILTLKVAVPFNAQENGTYDVWISIKSNGLSFLPESTDKINSISIDRVVLVKPVIAGDATISNKWTVFTPLSRTDTFSTEILKSIPQQVTVGSKTIKPQFADVTGGSIDLASMMSGSVKDRSALVFTSVNVRKTGKLTFGFGADWWLQAWLDGELICDTTIMGNPAYPPSMKDNIVTVPVEKGEHILAIRFINGEASSLLAVGAGDELRQVMQH